MVRQASRQAQGPEPLGPELEAEGFIEGAHHPEQSRGKSAAQYQPWAPRLYSGPWACRKAYSGRLSWAKSKGQTGESNGLISNRFN